ncbi:MAG: hypothetical protein QM692_09795 [Thermomicrobiales bacterium]
MCVLISGLILHTGAADAGKGRNRKQGAVRLVNRDLTGSAWTQDSVTVVNRSSYPSEYIAYAARLWSETSAPNLTVTQEAATPCTSVRPQAGVIIICDGVPWWEGANPVAGFTANYAVKPKAKKGKGKRKAAPAIAATVIWLFEPGWDDPGVLRYIPSHELGHALGLGEMDCACVMSPMVSDYDTLAHEEWEAMKAIYP